MNAHLHRRAPILTLALLATSLAAEPTTKIKPLDDVTVVVTDLTDAGRELPIPSPQHPVYYIGLNLGFGVFAGSSLGGDPPPDEKAMLQTVVAVLAQQGYRGEDQQHPATQIIACTWGVIGSSGHNLSGPGAGFYFLGGDKFPHLVESNPIPGHSTPEVLLRGFSGGRGATVLEMSHDSLYVVLLSGFDAEAHEKGKVVKLWETRLACSSPGNSLARSLPRLVVSGQHMIGRETVMPVVENAARTRQAWVEIGETKFLDYVDPADLEKAREAAREQQRQQPAVPTPAEAPPSSPFVRPAK